MPEVRSDRLDVDWEPAAHARNNIGYLERFYLNILDSNLLEKSAKTLRSLVTRVDCLAADNIHLSVLESKRCRFWIRVS